MQKKAGTVGFIVIGQKTKITRIAANNYDRIKAHRQNENDGVHEFLYSRIEFRKQGVSSSKLRRSGRPRPYSKET